MDSKWMFKLLAVFIIPLMVFGGAVQAVDPYPNLSQFGVTGSTPTLPAPVAADVQSLVVTSGTFQEGIPWNPAAVPGAWNSVDPNSLFLTGGPQNIGIFLVGENAGFRNDVGISIGQDYSLQPGDPQSLFKGVDTGNVTLSSPFDTAVQLGVGPGKLDFFLAADASNPVVTQPNLYWTDTTLTNATAPVNSPGGDGAIVNPDGLQHALAFLHSSGQFLLYAWSDLPDGGDMDFNDLFYLVGARSIEIPEPSTYLLLGGFLLAVMMLKRKRVTT